MKRSSFGILVLSLVMVSVAGAQGKAKKAKAKKPAPPAVGAFVVRLGSDTVAVEQYARSSDKLEGDVVLRSPTTRVLHYVATLDKKGTVTRMETAVRAGNAAPDAPPMQNFLVTWTGDTAVVEIRRADSVRTIRVATRPGTVPYLGNSYALYELALKKAINAKDSVALSMLPVGAPAVAMLNARRVGKDTIYITTQNGLLQARVDRKTGQILGSRIVGGTQQFTAERVKLKDFPALVAAFAARDAAGARMGQLSPPDSVKTTIGSANVAVNYSRPSRRGRTVFGGTIVPWGQVWRTGANSATMFKTDADLMIGSTLVPAGTYTLFSLPTQDGWTLIVNRQTGQWGTEYHEDRDLARIPMSVTKLSAPVEQFVIAIEPAATGSTLRMAWEDRQATVGITPK